MKPNVPEPQDTDPVANNGVGFRSLMEWGLKLNFASQLFAILRDSLFFYVLAFISGHMTIAKRN